MALCEACQEIPLASKLQEPKSEFTHQKNLLALAQSSSDCGFCKLIFDSLNSISLLQEKRSESTDESSPVDSAKVILELSGSSPTLVRPICVTTEHYNYSPGFYLAKEGGK